MPLGAKLTKNDSTDIFWNEFWHEIETGTYANQFKRLKQFSRIKMSWMQEMIKIPFFMNFANNIEIKCRDICNWSETNSNDFEMQERYFGWLEMQENMDKYTIEKICNAKLRDKAE